DDVDLVGLEERDAIPRGHRDQLDLLFVVEESAGEPVGDVDVEADVLARSIDGAEGRKIRLHAGDELAALLDRLVRGLSAGRSDERGDHRRGHRRDQHGRQRRRYAASNEAHAFPPRKKSKSQPRSAWSTWSR